MPVCNIHEGRRGCKACVDVMVVFEACWHDNSMPGATQFPEENIFECDYFGVEKTTIELAIRYANQRWPTLPVCLYVYDVDCNNVENVKSLQIDPESGLVVEVH